MSDNARQGFGDKAGAALKACTFCQTLRPVADRLYHQARFPEDDHRKDR